MAKRYFVNVTMEIFVPEQGLGKKATKNENGDARWFAETIATKTYEHIKDEFKHAERDYHLNEVQVNYLQN
jgi:hypothetical protein